MQHACNAFDSQFMTDQNQGSIHNISGGFLGFSSTLYGVWKYQLFLPLWHIVTEHCTDYYVMLYLT